MPSLGNTPGLIVAAGVGAAASAALNPAFEVPKQEAWFRNPQRLLDTGTIAELVARGGVLLGNPDGSTPGSAYAEARRQGHAASRLDRRVWLAQRMPDYGTLRTLANRQLLKEGQLEEALNRHAYPEDWHKPLTDLFTEILSPGEIAAAIHRGLIPAPSGLLKGQQPEPPFNVDAYPVYDKIDALLEALGHGYDRDHLGVLVGLQGLPMGPHEAAQAEFRKIITYGDYIRAFNESNNRNEWAEAIYEQSKQIPTARDFFENALRGHHDFDWARQQAERHGMSKDDSLIIYQNQGRPLNLHQITQALAWGATYNPGVGDDPDPWMQSVLLGPVRPEFYDMQHTLKYNLPSAFYFRALQQQDVIKEAEAVTWYKRLGWPPDLAAKVAKAYATTTTGATADPWVTKARNQLWTAIHRSFLNGELDRAGADSKLTTLIPDLGARSEVLDLWTIEDEATTKPLSPANVKKGYKASDYTIDEAIARLVAQQWSAADANVYLTT